MNKKIISHMCFLALCGLALPASADEFDTRVEEGAQLQSIEVLGSREGNEETTVSRYLRDNIVKELRDSVKMVPGVTSGNEAGRGNAGFNIRGLGGNRVKMTLDGAGMPYSISGWGHSGAAFGRGSVEMDTIRSIGITKGPDATFADSSNLGGKVAMRTIRPSDYVSEDKPWHFGFYPTWRSENNLFKGSVLGAGKAGDFGALLLLTGSSGHETKTMGKVDGEGRSRTKADPKDENGLNALAKIEWKHNNHSATFLAEHYWNKGKTNRLSSRGPAYRGIVRDSVNRIEYNRSRLGFNFKRENLPSWMHRLEFDAWLNHTDYEKTDERSMLVSLNSGKPRGGAKKSREAVAQGGVADLNKDAVIKDSRSKENLTQTMGGVSLTLDARAVTGPVNHDFTLYGDARYEYISRPQRDYVLKNGSYVEENRSPVKWTPDTGAFTAGLTLRDRMSFKHGWALIPRARVEWYNLQAKSDEAFRNSQVDWVPHYKNVTINPGLRLEKSFGQHTLLWGSWSRGERNPPFFATTSFIHPPVIPGVERMQFFPAKNLKTELSNNFEVGVRSKTERFTLETAFFHNSYKNFIQLFGKRIKTDDPKFYFLETTNRDRAKTWGLEAAWSYKFTDKFSVAQTATWMRGNSTDDGKTVPLNSVQPTRLETSAAWNAEKWRLAVYWSLVAKMNDWSSDKAFKTPGYNLWDVVLDVKPLKWMTIQAGVYNVFNTKHYHSQDIELLNNSGAKVTDFNTLPGRNYAVRLKIDL